MTAPPGVPHTPPAPDVFRTGDRPAALAAHDAARYRAAADRAKRLWPGAVGELLHREILYWSGCGFRGDQSGIIPRAVDQIMKTAGPS